ncbi:integral membrane protein [Mycolicibacterium brisbanense]|uniref:methanethiol S-methyltransferase n=2 Tax=Mycolicibacterium brisbanense TaxID=146020 RepID=A0A100VUT0_9MYCO|nr:integral membrane protein [Mycolicibacterium brisbanense]
MAMNRYFAITYGAISYVLFLAVFVYAIGFVGGLTPRSVDDATSAPVGVAVVVDVLLMTLFAAQHSVMARPGFKRWWGRYVPTAVERSTYVLCASSTLALLMWQWRSIPAVVWDIDWRPARMTVWTLFWLGWGIVLASTFMISHFELFGLRQVFNTARPHSETGFRTTLFYRVVRHPLNLGFIVAFWAAPTMTLAHLLFATVTTGWILLAIQLEERDLLATLGARYAAYRETVPMLVPRLPGRRATSRVNLPAAQRFSCRHSARSVRR